MLFKGAYYAMNIVDLLAKSMSYFIVTFYFRSKMVKTQACIHIDTFIERSYIDTEIYDYLSMFSNERTVV